MHAGDQVVRFAAAETCLQPVNRRAALDARESLGHVLYQELQVLGRVRGGEESQRVEVIRVGARLPADDVPEIGGEDGVGQFAGEALRAAVHIVEDRRDAGHGKPRIDLSLVCRLLDPAGLLAVIAGTRLVAREQADSVECLLQASYPEGSLVSRRAAAMRFGERVRHLRLEKKLGQRGLAKQVGVTFTYISKIENEKLDFGDYPSEVLILRLAEAWPRIRKSCLSWPRRSPLASGGGCWNAPMLSADWRTWTMPRLTGSCGRSTDPRLLVRAEATNPCEQGGPQTNPGHFASTSSAPDGE